MGLKVKGPQGTEGKQEGKGIWLILFEAQAYFKDIPIHLPLITDTLLHTITKTKEN